MKDHIATMKVAIERKNSAMEKCVDILMMGDDNIYALGKTREGYANWAISSRDSSSYWGHYFTTRQDAMDDMRNRAGASK